MPKTTLEILNKIQQELNAPKNQYNKFGKYNYRSCEDILSAVKPLLGEAVLTLEDEIVEISGRFYVKATAKLVQTDDVFSCTAYARESENKKGMDASQITGAASSYARKYALNGLFAIDDTKDSDSTNKHKQTSDNQASLKQRKFVADLLRQNGKDKQDLYKKFGMQKGDKLTSKQASDAIDWLQNIKDATDKVVDDAAKALK